MSDPVTPMNGAVYTHGIAKISEVIPTGMITLRGALADKGFAKALRAATGLDVPGTREILHDGDLSLAWMSSDELLLICPHMQALDRTQQLADELRDFHALAVNVSDARALFEVSGPHAREVLAKLAPVDLAPGQFGPGDMRRTRLAQAAAALWMPAPDVFRIICFRSVAQYTFDVLKVAAQPGSQVGVFHG
ncbi:sarcosine oxidase subunit gamma [Sulfitobacter albidus]|uniref:Sarcosine oxidase subunit gamma n=1 Tax=Sulfitobacter albidus TaxID=2829501 RepID=A0A975JFB4_9RHOB|nr:sarcosine oxidase subunit gamma family protein [Sulfitobacter albidus]QUJ77277.1 sarcosine oxidase subunit gamma [Sulfitobacter albidus]